MNDLDARRLLLADPRHLSAELREAIERQPALAEFRDELLRLDERVRVAATAAPVPDGLADRLVLRARYGKPPILRLAIAAAVATLAIAIPWHAWRQSRDATFEVAMMDHVRESVSELKDDSGVEEGVLRTSLADIGVRMREAPFRIRHLGYCIVAGRQGRHFTVDGPGGVVSFVLLPAQAGSAPATLVNGDTLGVYEQHGSVLIGAFGNGSVDRGVLERLVQRMFA